MTLLNVVLSVFPIVKVESRASFAVKIITVIIASNLIGASIFAVAGRNRRNRSQLSRSIPVARRPPGNL